METTIIYYRDVDGNLREVRKPFYTVDGGVVLFHNEWHQEFIPFGQIVRIEQQFTTDMGKIERFEKSLVNRMRRR